MLRVWAFSSCGEQGLFSRCGAWASHCGGFSCCRTLILGAWASGVAACGLSSCGTWGLTDPQHMRSSWTRDQTSVPYIARQILNLWTTRKAPYCFLIFANLKEQSSVKSKRLFWRERMEGIETNNANQISCLFFLVVSNTLNVYLITL